MLNPLAFMIEEARKVVYWGSEPNWTMFAINMVVGLIVCAAGFAFSRKQRKVLPMSSDNIAISVSNISKCYNIYLPPG
jgi:ABC-type polysaccharide/polyol phosphate export permease